MFIHSNKALLFKAEGNELRIDADYIGSLPEWATKTILYDWAVKDGSITFVGDSTPTPVDLTSLSASDLAAKAAEYAEAAKVAKAAEDAAAGITPPKLSKKEIAAAAKDAAEKADADAIDAEAAAESEAAETPPAPPAQ